MSDFLTPDTRDAAMDALVASPQTAALSNGHATLVADQIVDVVLAADRNELARQGFVIVPAERYHALERWHAATEAAESAI